MARARLLGGLLFLACITVIVAADADTSEGIQLIQNLNFWKSKIESERNFTSFELFNYQISFQVIRLPLMLQASISDDAPPLANKRRFKKQKHSSARLRKRKAQPFDMAKVGFELEDYKEKVLVDKNDEKQLEEMTLVKDFLTTQNEVAFQSHIKKGGLFMVIYGVLSTKAMKAIVLDKADRVYDRWKSNLKQSIDKKGIIGSLKMVRFGEVLLKKDKLYTGKKISCEEYTTFVKDEARTIKTIEVYYSNTFGATDISREVLAEEFKIIFRSLSKLSELVKLKKTSKL
ncbi:hypothetical protein R1flu_001801 [Riccia fluitans]|uniref:Uncharacterized protein n=1 Tax=Riccia fluitans TaxID=41844 RepID=A0ABD1Y4B8_9MARC